MNRFARPSLLAIIVASVAASGPQAQSLTNEKPNYGARQCKPTPRGWQRQGSEFGELMIFNRLEVSRARIIWNDKPISPQVLTSYLKEAEGIPSIGMQLVIGPSALCTEVEVARRAISTHLPCGYDRACVEYSKADWIKTRPPARRR